MKGTIKCIIATIAFGMGINNKYVRLVIQYGCSSDLETYYQEIGRAGRDGENSECHMFYSSKDFTLNRYFLNEIEGIDYRKYREEQIIKIEKFVYSTRCRRKMILEHFGEITDYDKCNNCDNCHKICKVIKDDFTKEAFMLIRLIYKYKYRYGCIMLINILRGSNSKKIKDTMTKLSIYGRGNKKSEKWWKEFIRVLITEEFLYEKAVIGGFGSIIETTSKSIEWYKSIRKSIRKSQKNNAIESDYDYDKIENTENQLILPVTDMLLKCNTDNTKDIKKNYIELLEDVCISEISFTPEIESVDSKNGKKLSETKLISYKLFIQNKTIDEISKIRELKKQTIENHIVCALKYNLNIDINKFGLNNQIYAQIKKAINSDIIKNNTSKLQPIREILPKTISYFHIKLSIIILDNKLEETVFNITSI